MTLLEKNLRDAQEGVQSLDIQMAVALEIANIETKRAELEQAVAEASATSHYEVALAQQKLARVEAIANSTPTGSNAVEVIENIIRAQNSVNEVTQHVKDVTEKYDAKVAAARANLAAFNRAVETLFAEVA